MLTEAHLSLAVTRGILTIDQAQALRGLKLPDATSQDFEGAGEERFRIANGFNEVFVALGMIVLGFGLFASLGNVPNALSNTLSNTAAPELRIAPFALGYAALLWGLAEYITARIRLLAPSIVLAILFTALVFIGVMILTLRGMAEIVTTSGVDIPQYRFYLALAFAIASALTAGLAFLHHWRFRLPFSLLLIAGWSAASVALLVVAFAPVFAENNIAAIGLGLGLAIFAAAMTFDLSDPQRQTIRSDGGFWLHMAAAPLVVHTLVMLLTGSTDSSVQTATTTLAIFVVLALVAVLVDRRAIRVAALGYLIAAIAYLVSQSGADVSQVFFITPLIVGASVIVLGLGWQPLRRAVWFVLPFLGPFDVLRPKAPR